MTLNYEVLKHWEIPSVTHSYDFKDTILYALALGYGENATSPECLKFTYEEGLQAAPSMAVILGYPGFWMRDPGTGIDWVKMLHGEQRLTIHERIPTAGTLIGKSRVKSISDKGANKGAVVVVARDIVDSASDTLVATVEQVSFLRGNGGYSTSGQPSDSVAAGPSLAGEASQKISIEIRTREDMALFYRLCGDFNPLHADPAVARKAGFERPILHGLATYGLACRALIRGLEIHDPFDIKVLNARFSSPVYPGETISFEICRQEKEVSFTATSIERNVVVMKDGYCALR